MFIDLFTYYIPPPPKKIKNIFIHMPKTHAKKEAKDVT